ncbi:MAG: SDR family oxidoreductase [Armatimonadota bacterium]|nr:MAG: SDR family oxidoreductase [Armatimonadota bacterium]
MSCLKDRIAVVTGASRGIGRAVAELFAHHGATVILTARGADDLDEVTAAITQAGGQALAVPGDVTDEAFVASLFDTIRRRFGRLDILVNNAGISAFGAVEELPVAELRRCLELNVVAAFACMQQAIRLMKDTGGTGKIINIGSVRSHWSEAGDAGAYNASKYGLRGMTESVARQLHGAGLNIAVGIVCPGVVDTTLTNPGGEPRPDWLQPETVAQAVLHAVTAPPDVNIFDTVLIPLSQKPW